MDHIAAIYHIALRPEWEAVLESGAPAYAPAAASRDGFIHCSFWRQVYGVAKRHYSGRSDVVVLEIDPAGLSDVQVEDTNGTFEGYPHVYGSIPRAAVCGTLGLWWGDGGNVQIVRSDCGSAESSDGGHAFDPVSLELRPARSEDLEFLTLLGLQLREDEGYEEPMSRSACTERMTGFIRGADGHRVHLLVAAGATVGYAVMNAERTPVYLRQLFVRRGLRRCGIGRRAVELLRAAYGGGPMDVEVLSSNDRAATFWRGQGFRNRYVGMRFESEDRQDIHPGPAGGAGPRSAARDDGRPDGDLPPVTTRLISGLASDRAIRDATEFILDNLVSYNTNASEQHRLARAAGAIRELVVLLVDPEDRWVGGVRGSVCWDWLEVRYFWVSERYRGRRLGSTMLAELERWAAGEGARRSRLSTFSFQAASFYERHGYRVVGEIADFPPGESLYWMQKDGLG